MNIRLGTFVTAVLIGGASFVAHAGVEQGQVVAKGCVSCHGAQGQGMGKTPALAGLKADFIVEQIKAFQSGKRNNMMMSTIARKLSEQDALDVAAYFASLSAK
jgi:cytochrome c553